MFSKKPKQEESLDVQVRRARRRHMTGALMGHVVVSAVGAIVVGGITKALTDKIVDSD